MDQQGNPLAGLDLESARQLLSEAQSQQGSPFQLLNQVDPSELGTLDRYGIPDWFPRTHPSTGGTLTPRARRTWFRKALQSQMSQSFGGTNPHRFSPNLPVSVLSKHKQLEALISLLFMKYARDNGFLPTPESL